MDQGVYDPKLIRRELFNSEKFAVTVEVDQTQAAYIIGQRVTFAFPGGAVRKILEPGHWLMCPHGYLIVTGPKGMPKNTPINLIENFGNNIGKGFKNPSLPIGDREWLKKGRK